jgi:hypothetical protein
LIQAENVVRRLPAALDAHEAGVISDYHLRILSDLTFRLDDTQIATVEAKVLERAGDQTPSQFRAAVTRAVAKVDPVIAMGMIVPYRISTCQNLSTK